METVVGPNIRIIDINDPPELKYVSGRDIFQQIKDKENPVGIEIGVDEGATSWYFLTHHPTLRLYGIDPYQAYQDWYPGGYLSDSSVNRAKRIMEQRLAPYTSRWTHYRMTSDQAVEKFADESCDFIFIDGLHEYDQVLKDCKNYYPKIKKGGVFAGHDYGVIEGVRRAVNEFAVSVGRNELAHFQDSDAWFWIKE